MKNEKEITETLSSGDSSCIKKRNVDFLDIENSELTWFKQCRDNNIVIFGPLLKEQANYYAKDFGHRSFRARNGWLEKFKRRQGIVFKKVRGESAGEDNNVCVDWRYNLQAITSGYKLDDIKNADETGMVNYDFQK